MFFEGFMHSTIQNIKPIYKKAKAITHNSIYKKSNREVAKQFFTFMYLCDLLFSTLA